MKLLKSDIEYLLSMGESVDTIEQIKRAKRIIKLTNAKGERITQDKAVEILGRKEFLSGLDRASFHWTAYRENENGESVYFDASKLFED